MGVKLIIPGRLPGLNDMIDAARGNKYEAARQKKENTELVMWYAKKAKLPKMKRVNVSVVWYEPNEKRDPDNVEAGIKFLLDGLVSAGVLANDGRKQIGTIKHDVLVDKDKPRIEIEIEEVAV